MILAAHLYGEKKKKDHDLKANSCQSLSQENKFQGNRQNY